MMSPTFQDYLRYTWQLLNGRRVQMERGRASKGIQDVSPYLVSHRSLRILELANGRLRPQYMLWKAAGHQVFGIDLANQSRLALVDIAYRIGRLILARQVSMSNATSADQTLVCGDVSTLPFVDSYFDLVLSANAFEHFLDVPTVVSELHRVLRPGGVVWVTVHLFTCLSGGHNLSFTEIPLHTIPIGVEPWDHLRRRRLPFSVPLNEWRKDQYLDEFALHFQILKHYCLFREGEELLTPELEAELYDFSRDDLTCRTYVIVAGKAPVTTTLSRDTESLGVLF